MPAGTTSISRHFAALPDPRVERTKAHRLVDILTIGLCAVICGADGWTAMEAFGRAKEPWLRAFLALPHGIPSHDTFGRVFSRLDPEAFGQCFAAWVRAVDGKTLRGSRDRPDDRAALHLVSAWAGASGLVLGQVAVGDKSNEITAIPLLLRLLDLEGCLVTIDAMGCQTAIAAQLVAQRGDDALALKDNQPTLHEQVRLAFAEARAADFAGYAATAHDDARTVDQDHGRLEIRRHWTLHDPQLLADLDPTGQWAGLRGLGLVEAERRVGDAVTVERRHYLLSAPLSAAAFGRAVRHHWGIENRVHWVLDVTFREDACRVRADHAPQNLAVLRHFALNLLRRERSHKGSIATKRFVAALDDSYLATILAGVAAIPSDAFALLVAPAETCQK
ncbi:MAG TPA: ISAs1 family transposase [Thermomicrobiales bacterium]|nr:ISAs1 family transposase [Thermomicrobiales bacterium]